MKIPKRGLEKFVREIVNECTISQMERIERYAGFTNYAMFGSDNPANAAIYNKTFAYLDDLDSLLFSPISLRFQIGDPDDPNILNEAKGRAAAARLRSLSRESDTDTSISDAVHWSLVKGKSFIKQGFKRGQFSPEVVMPDAMGVLRENHDKLDEDMEAFTHSMLITPYQFARMIWNHPDKEYLERKAKRYTAPRKGFGPEDGSRKQVIVGGLYPFQPADSNTPNQTRGIVDWMGGPGPTISPRLLASMMVLDEVWVWDDDRRDWATFHIIGDDMLISGKYAIHNLFAFDTVSGKETPALAGRHPFTEVCPNRMNGYFWGLSEITNIALLQEAINSRLNGINRILRKQEEPPVRIIGGTGVNQAAISRFNKPGGYWSDSNPNAKVEPVTQQVGQELWASLHEYERMFDEMGGLPPIAKGHGEAGVRSGSHADTLVRMFSPRFKDRALLVERSVEELGTLMLNIGRAHIDKQMTAWVPAAEAGLEATPPKEINPFEIAPVGGFMPVKFRFTDLDDDATLSVDSHSSSPAFAAESKALVFDLFKIGAMGAEDVLQHVDAPDPEELIYGVQRRKKAMAEQQEKALALKAIRGGKG